MMCLPAAVGGFAVRGGAPSPFENLTTFTEVDSSSRLTLTTERVTAANLQRNVTAYLYKDFGVDHFAGDFSIDLDIRLTASENGGLIEFLALCNDIGDFGFRSTAISVAVYRDASNNILQLIEGDGGPSYSDAANISLNTTYYCRFERDESVGTYGTAYLHIASSDADRTSETWIDTLEMALHTSLKNYRYLYAMAGLNSALTPSISGWSEKFLINTP